VRFYRVYVSVDPDRRARSEPPVRRELLFDVTL
jgi:hypothetical protein